MSILVTGGTGFVGSNVVRTLAARGQPVVAYARQMPPAPAFSRLLGPLAARVTTANGDVLDRQGLVDVMRAHGVRAVVHCAVFNPVAYPPGVAAEQVRINAEATITVAEAAHLTGAARLVYVSTGSVYGNCDPSLLIPEDQPARPTALYGVTKYAGELLAAIYGHARGLDVVAVRISQPYGPMESATRSRPSTSLVYRAVPAALIGDELEVVVDPSGRDLTYVDDTAAGIAAIALQDALPHRCYNIAGGRSYSTTEVLEAVATLVPTFRYRLVAEGSVREPRGPVDIGRARRDLGFVPRYDLREGLAAYVHWLRTGEAPAPL